MHHEARKVATLTLMGDLGRARRWLLMAGVLSGACALAACEPRVRLQMPGPMNSHVVEGVANVRAHHPVSIGEMVVCVSSPGAVTITSVEPVHPVGRMRVQAFAVRPNPFLTKPRGTQLGDALGPLSASGFKHSHRVDVVCGTRPGWYELGLQLVKSSDEPASAAGWLVRYRSGDQEGKLTIPLGVVLCSQPSASAAGCRRLTDRLLR